MRTIKAMAAMLVVTSLLSSSVRAQDYASYFGRPLPVYYPHQVMSAVNNTVGMEWARSMKGIRVGNGQCAALVEMALAKSGARPGFFGVPSYYIWGGLVTGGVWAGDVVQFENCQFEYTTANGMKRFTFPHHTAIVGAVSGNSIQLIHQNADGVGPVVIETINLSWKKEGTITFWRPVRW